MEEENENAPSQFWPSWRYGPGGRSEIFTSPEEVPAGWEDHPSKVSDKPIKDEDDEKDDDPYKGWGIAKMKEELKERKVDFNDKWPPHKLLSLLKQSEK